jgi:ribosomal protein S20
LANKSKKIEKILKAISLTDKAVKSNIIHKNKAARMKSGLYKLFPKKYLLQSSPAKKKVISKK